MSLPEFSLFADALRGMDRRDRTELKRHIARSRELRELAREREVPELAYCLNAIGNLLAALAAPGDFIDGGVLQAAAIRLVNSVEDSLAQDVRELPPKRPQVKAPTTLCLPPEDQISLQLESSALPPLETLPQPIAQSAPLKAAASPAPQHESTPVMELDSGLGKDSLLLGRFLVELEQITRTELAAALRMHRKTRLPLGECLLLMGKVLPEKIMETLRIQERLRAEQQLANPAAPGPAQALRPKAAPAAPFPKPARAALPPKLSRIRSRPSVEMHVTKQMFLGEVFLGADMITMEQLEKAMHIHHHQGVRIGQALIMLGAIDEQGLECGLELQMRLRNIAQHSSADAKRRIAGA